MKSASISCRNLAKTFAAVALLTTPALLSAQVSLSTVVELAAKNSTAVRLASADVVKARASLTESRDAFVPSLSFGSGLPAFPEVGFTGNLPTIWDATIQSMVFSLPQIRYIQAAKAGLQAAEWNLKSAHEQVVLDASTAYIELDTVNRELDTMRQQEGFAGRLVDIEQQRAEAGVDPLSDFLGAKLTGAQLKLKRLHLESRAVTLAKQISSMTGLPPASIVTDHASIPDIPAIKADQASRTIPELHSALDAARAKQLIAKGDEEHTRLLPEVAFGVQYNRNTTLLNEINKYYKTDLPANNFSSGFSIRVPIFDSAAYAKSHESAAEALRAKVEAEQARQQRDLQIATLTSSLRELDAQAEVATLKQQISDEQLKAVLSQLELGNGSGAGPGSTPQLSPKAEQQARINASQDVQEALEAGLDLTKARLNLLRALGHMQDWLNELHSK